MTFLRRLAGRITAVAMVISACLIDSEGWAFTILTFVFAVITLLLCKKDIMLFEELKQGPENGGDTK